MSMGGAGALQAALYDILSNAPALTGQAIYDEVPPGPVNGTFVSIGTGDTRDLSDASGSIGAHRIDISVISDAEGFQAAKAVAEAVSDAVTGAKPVLTRGRVVLIAFDRARTRRVRAGQLRRIDMTFRAIIEDN